MTEAQIARAKQLITLLYQRSSDPGFQQALLELRKILGATQNAVRPRTNDVAEMWRYLRDVTEAFERGSTLLETGPSARAKGVYSDDDIPF